MRDPARIQRILELLQREWNRNPDLRLGQLIENALIKSGTLKTHHTFGHHHCLYHLEDDLVEMALGGESHPLFVGENPWGNMHDETDA